MPENNASCHPSWKKSAALFLASQNLSLFGSSVTGFAIIWHVTLKTSSGTWMMLIILFSMLPQVPVSLWGGVWADRYNRKHLIMASDGSVAAATLILFILHLAGHDHLGLLLAVSGVRSLGAGVQMPAVSAMIPQVVPENQLTRFSGINQSLNAASQFLAPAIGGVVLGTVGIAWAFLLDGVTAAAAAILILRGIPVSPVSLSEKQASAWTEMKEGALFSWHHPLLKALILFYGVSFFLISPAAFLTPVMIARSFGDDVWRLTANELVWTAGSLIGGAYIAWKGAFHNKVRVIALSLAGFGILFLLLGVCRSFGVYLVLMGVAGLILPFLTTAETVLIQEQVPMGVMGRVFSIVQMTGLVAMPAGMLVFGPMADHVPIELILVVTGWMLAGTGLLFLKIGGRALESLADE
ncbi:MFS transporter [Desulfosarcina sp. OttesenSCG-928-A07]|nr:MFS transporter [Desulfosarcina sp. OttesenSCG-928-G17]MDL2328315.1 MFS transporter [Desulfosarcina sp. OttesenSCG-928-A07]